MILCFVAGCGETKRPVASTSTEQPAAAETATEVPEPDGTRVVESTKPTSDEFEPYNVRYRESRFLRDQDRFIATDYPAVVPVSKEILIEDDDDVLGFLIDGHARAYSVRALSYHHVVNDLIGDTPVAVTY